jgi:mono/diheme cytochrome c family protein
MKIQIASASLMALAILATPVRSQQPTIDDVEKGRQLAELICSSCHIVAPDQKLEPILQPAAPSFESIAQRTTIDGNFIRSFLKATRRAQGMPNPELPDSQIEQVTAYLLSLGTHAAPAGPQAGECSVEIARLEGALGQAQGAGHPIGSARESTAARLHRQPTPSTVEQARIEAELDVITALVAARRLQSEGTMWIACQH